MEMAMRHQVAAIDHLEHATEAAARALSGTDVISTLLPCASFNHGCSAPARALIDAGVAVALGTNFNPHHTPTLNMQAGATMGVLAAWNEHRGSHQRSDGQQRLRAGLLQPGRVAGAGQVGGPGRAEYQRLPRPQRQPGNEPGTPHDEARQGDLQRRAGGGVPVSKKARRRTACGRPAP